MKKILTFIIIILIVVAAIIFYFLSQKETEQTPTTAYDQNSWKQIIPDTCLKFYDGCNECFRENVGDQNPTCTEIYCGGVYQQPVCQEESNEISFEQCESLGGEVLGSPGNRISCPDGQTQIGFVPLGIEGGICCK